MAAAQLAKGQCDSNTLLNKLLTGSLHEMIIGILLFMLLCSPTPMLTESCKQMSHRATVGLGTHPVRILSPFTLFPLISAAA